MRTHARVAEGGGRTLEGTLEGTLEDTLGTPLCARGLLRRSGFCLLPCCLLLQSA